MTRSSVSCAALFLGVATVLSVARPAAIEPLTISGYEKVSEFRVTRTVTEYVYRAILTNTGVPLPGARAIVVSLSAATTVVDDTVTFGPTVTGDTVASLDTFTFRHDRSAPFDFATFQWTITPTTGNVPPIANAGVDQQVGVGQAVALNGAGSTDADGDPLTFAWAFQSRPAGSSAVLQNPASIAPTFTIDIPGTYVIGLVVNDGFANSVADFVSINTDNAAPNANAGPDRTVTVGQTVTLDGSASTDVDGDPLTFSWALVSVPSGSAAALSSPVALKPTFVADLPGTYIAQLIVNDGLLSSAPDSVTIVTGQNAAPLADAGPDRTAAVAQVVVLDGSASSDPEGNPLTFAWSMISRPAGSTATLVSPTAVSPFFTVDQPGTFVLQLIVNDGFVNSQPDTVTVSTANTPPVASAGPDQLNVTPGSTVSLDGSSSTDVNGNPLTFQWSLLVKPGASSATLGSPSSVFPTFTADVPGDYVAQLIVNDGFANSAPDTVLVHVVSVPPTVGVEAVDALASEVGPDPGTFRFTRTGSTSNSLTVSYTIAGSAQAGTDYQSIAGSVSIAAGESFAEVTITPVPDGSTEGDETVVLTIQSDAAYSIGASSAATVTIRDTAVLPAVSVAATIASASEAGSRIGRFRFTRTGSTASPLTVTYAIGGTATNGVDYSAISGTILIAAGQGAVNLTITPVNDALPEPSESVIVTITPQASYTIGSAASATVTIADGCGDGGVLVNGSTHCGSIARPGEVDTWTFTATAGDRLSVHAGEVSDNNGFRPWLRLVAPGGTPLGSAFNLAAAEIGDVIAPTTGTYQVLVASADALAAGTGTYRITFARTPGPITVSSGDQGGPLANGAMHTGDIWRGDLDVWTFTAAAGERIALHIGEVTDTDDFRPWIRLWAPNGATLGSAFGVAAAELGDVLAPVTGTYLVLVASADSGVDGTGTYRLTLARTGAAVTVSSGDHGGALSNGGLRTGEIVRGDLDAFTFTATAGDRIAVHIGEIMDTDDFRPWIRLWAPNGATLGSSFGLTAAELGDVIAPVTGTYLVLVASADVGADGTGTYRLTLARTGAAVTVSSGDQGGALTNGGVHSGEILRGDLDAWTFSATAGDRIAVRIGEITDSDDFRPWIRVWAPNGATLGSAFGVAAAELGDVLAPVTGTYLVLVASADPGVDGTGTYRLTLARTGAAVTVSSGDQGGALSNGGLRTGEIVRGDLDVWTFAATAGERIAVHIGEITETDDFRPWIRLWAPNGATLGSSFGLAAAELGDVIAPVTGTYLVVVGSADVDLDGTGSYRLSLARTGAAVTVSGGDQGGPIAFGALRAGEIVRGDIDVWTFTATAGDVITVQINETAEADDFRPWIRVWASTGATFGSAFGLAAAAIGPVTVPVTGTYFVIVGSADPGVDGSGSYTLQVLR